MLATLADDVPGARAGRSRSSGTGIASSRQWPGRGGASDAEGPGLHGRFANVAKELVKALKTPDCVVDGEVCALDEKGRPSFSAMQQSKTGTPIVYFVFDLLEVEGEPIIDLPLVGATKTAREAARQEKQDRPFLRELRRRAGTAAGRQAAARGDRGQAGEVEVPARQAHARLAEDRHTAVGVRDRGLHTGVRAGGRGRSDPWCSPLIAAVSLVYVGNVGTGFTEQEIERSEGAQATAAGQGAFP